MSTLVSTTKLPVPKVVKELPVNKNADTNDWDTVFAIRYIDANTAIRNNWSKVNSKAKNVLQSASDYPEFKVNGVLGPWQLTLKGDGENIRFKCPFVSGTYDTGEKKYDIKDYIPVIEVAMEWVPDPDQFAFTVSGNETVNKIKSALDKSTIDDALKAEFKNNGKTLSAKAAASILTSGKDWLITDDKINFYIFYNYDKYQNEFLHIYQFEESWKTNLKILKEDDSGEPAVTLVTIENNKTDGIAAAVLPQLLSEWFNSNIGDLNYVFSMLNLDPILSKKDKYNWIKPTASSYAVIDSGTLENSIFGVLTMTQNNTPPLRPQVSPNAIPSGNDANAGFLISGTAFMKNMMLTGARSIFDNAPEDSFHISNDGLTVTNIQDMVWGRFKKDAKPMISVASSYAGELDNGKLPEQMVQDFLGTYFPTKSGGYWDPGIEIKGFSVHVTRKGANWYIASPDNETVYLLELNGDKIDAYHSMIFTIKKQQFKMSLINSFLEVQFIDLKYPESWEYDVHINYTEQVAIGLTTVGDKQLFWFDRLTKDMTINVTKTQTSITVNIVEGAVLAVIGLIAAVAPLIDGIRAAVSIGEVTDDLGTATITVEGFEEAFDDTSSVDIEENETDALINGAEQVRGGWTGFKNAFTSTRWKVLGGIAGVIGAIVGGQAAVEAIMEAIAKGDWEKVPAFDEFANKIIVPYSWPGISGYDLKSTQLASSLQIGLKTKSGDEE